MNIEGFDKNDQVTFDSVKTTIDIYTQRLNEIKAEIEMRETHIKLLEDDETILVSAETTVENTSLKDKIKKLIDEFRETHIIHKKKENLNDLYQERRDMLNDIKSLFIVADLPTNLCSLCLERPVDIFLKECCHTFCSQCLSKISYNKCPMCRTSYTFTDVRTLIFS
jgi:cell division protein FtsB